MLSGFFKKAFMMLFLLSTITACRSLFEDEPVKSEQQSGQSLEVCQIDSGTTLTVYGKPQLDEKLNFGIGSGSEGSRVSLYVYEEIEAFYKVKARGPTTFADGEFHFVLKDDPKLKCEDGDESLWEAIKKREGSKPKVKKSFASKLSDQAPIYNGDGVYRCKGSALNFDKKTTYFDFVVTGRFGSEGGTYDSLNGKVLSANLKIDWKKTEEAKPAVDSSLDFYHSKLIKQWQVKIKEGTISLDFETEGGAAKAKLKLPGNLDKRSALPPFVISSLCQFDRFDGDETPILGIKSSDILIRYRSGLKVPFFCSCAKPPFECKEPYSYRVYGSRILNAVQKDPAPRIEVSGWQNKVVFSKEMSQRNGFLSLEKIFTVKPSFPTIRFSLQGPGTGGYRGSVDIEHVVSDGSEKSGMSKVKLSCY